MGQYTQSIREILQYNKTAQQKLTNPTDVLDISKACLFDEVPTGLIDQNYEDRFFTGFALHFMNDELGLETLPLWKISLNEKIYNSASYINKIFDNLDKEVFADYKVTNVEAEGSTSGEKRGTGTVTNVRDDERTTTTSDDLTHNTTDTATIVGTVTGTGTVANAKTGSDTLLRTGTDTAEKTGTDTVGHTGTDAMAHTGTQGTQGTNSQTTNNTGTTSNDHNFIQINSDTPMGSLDTLRTPGGDAKGTGVSYATGTSNTGGDSPRQYNYMTSASEVDESNVQTDDTTQEVSGSDSATTTFNDTNTETRNLQDETTYDSTTERTLDLSDATQYNSTNTETRNTQDATNRTDTTRRTGTDNRDIVTSVDGEITDTQTRNTTDAETGSHSDTTDTIDYSMNWEMLYKSMPLLNKVWEIFDDLFMIIF
jgi:hypothetical protein